MNGLALGRWLCQLAMDVGFDVAGIASLAPAQTARAWLEALSEGRHGSLSWMTRRVEVRLEPAKYCPRAQAALVVGVFVGDLASDAEHGWRGVARYAQYPDYHRWLGDAVWRLASRVAERFPAEKHWSAVDTAPLPERELAVRAGLGALGKHTLLIHPDFGSHLLLGVLLTTLPAIGELRPVADLCGHCRRCLEACPTGALGAYRLDARLCLTTWTVENRGEIPEAFRDPASERWFGCDACQDVCPWNRVRRQQRSSLLPPRLEPLDPLEVLELEAQQLAKRFEGTALLRPGVAGLRRNAAISLAKRDDARSLQVLIERLLQDPSAVVRAACAWSLGQRSEPEAKEALRAAAATEPEGAVFQAIVRALGEGHASGSHFR